MLTPVNKPVPTEVDCLILGGGITGAAAAWQASLRGLRVLLIDERDFASGTSRASSKLIHGGMRYFFQGRFVQSAVMSRERDQLLTHIAPTLVSPLRLLIPVDPDRRARRWLARSASAIHRVSCDRGPMPKSEMVTPAAFQRLAPLYRNPCTALSFWDAQVDDARLVLSTLRTACLYGADVKNYAPSSGFEQTADGWAAVIRDNRDEIEVHARTLINAAGPWVGHVNHALGQLRSSLRWIKGTHIVLRCPADFGTCGIIFKSISDGRPLWAIPWSGRLLVGTTEGEYHGDLRAVVPSTSEIEDLLSSFQAYFPAAGVAINDVCSAFSGVRPVADRSHKTLSTLSRWHRVDVDADRALITISGGKLTTFRRIGSAAADAAARLIGHRPPRRPATHLLGNRIWPGATQESVDHWITERRAAKGKNVPEDEVARLLRTYGSDALNILASANAADPPGVPAYPCLAAEVDYLARTERVASLADLLIRRTALHITADPGLRSAIARCVAQTLWGDTPRAVREVDAYERLRRDQLAALYSLRADADRKSVPAIAV